MPGPPAPKTTCELTGPAPPIALADLEMTPLCDDVYAEPGLPAAAASSLKTDYENARRNLATAFDQDLRSTPVVLFCQSPACKVAFGAPPAAARSSDMGFASATANTPTGEPVNRSLVVASGPFPRTVHVLTHELVHAEMKAWTPYDSLPTWFNEGMATYVAGEPSCDVGAAPAPSAPVVDVVPLASKEAWQAHLREHHDTHEVYCASRQRVARWVEGFGDARRRAAALKTLMAAVKSGTPFDRAFVL